MFGKNSERERFRRKVDEITNTASKGAQDRVSMPKPGMSMNEGASGETRIMHNEDGSHTVAHPDGEETSHPNLHHAMMEIHGKQHPGEPAHIAHVHEAGVTTHHVMHDGEPQGPQEHPDVESAGEHLKETMGGMEGEHESPGSDWSEGTVV